MANITINILDYKGRKTPVELDIDRIGAISMKVVTGDEILKVVYKDYTTESFDSSNDRLRDYFDGAYDVYNPETGVNLLEDQDWLNRESSYDY